MEVDQEFWLAVASVCFGVVFGFMLSCWDTVVWYWYKEGAFGYKPKKKQ